MSRFGQKELEKQDKELISQWRKQTAALPDSTLDNIMTLKRSGQSVRQICADLELPVEQVSIVVIEGFAKERGEKPEYTVRGF